MQPNPPARRLLSPSRALFLVLSLLLLALPGCDNPACVFGGNCLGSNNGGGGGGGGGGSQSGAVIFPVDGEWISDAAPSIQSLAPATPAAATTPVLLTFNESLNPSSVQGAFRIVDQTGLEPGSTPSTALLGDGRALVLLPTAPLIPGGTYLVQFGPGAVITDLTGTSLVKPVNDQVGSFQISSPGTTPRLVASWPPAGSTGNSAIGEVVLVFDRPIDPESVTTDSVAITVDGAALSPPAQAPQPLALAGSSTPERRVFTWRYVDADGKPIMLPAGARLRFELSPAGGEPIEDLAGFDLPTTVLEFDLGTFSLPVSAQILTDPTDAFGIEHLIGANPLMVEVEFAQETEEGDQLGILLFGVSGTSGNNIFRQRASTPAAGSSSSVLTPADLQLLESETPLQTIFADGGVGFAFRLSRGSTISPVRVMDVDPIQPGVQDPIQDTVPPVFLGFGTSGAQADTFRSDQFELAVVGRAGEQIRSVEVSATVDLGGELVTFTNGVRPPVAGSNPDGSFVAAPIEGASFDGLEGLPIQIALRVYDRALNAAPEVMATYVRRGVVGGGGPAGSMVLVRVFDVATLAPIAGARVFLHVRSDGSGGTGGAGGAVHALGPFPTDTDGAVLVELTPQAETILTVDADGYDLFTFQGVDTNLFDVPLRVAGAASAIAQSAVTSALPGLENFVSRAADSRRATVPLRSPVVEMACSTDPFTQLTTCVTLPDGELPGYLVAPDRLGAFTYFATESQAGPSSFDPADFLRAFLFSYPRPALAPSEVPQSFATGLTSYLADAAGTEESPIGVPVHLFDLTSVPGLFGTPTPRIRVEATSPAVPDPVTVGLGIPFNPDFDQVWVVRAAYPGAVDTVLDDEQDELGRLVQSGTIGSELLLAMEVVDELGNHTVLRTLVGADAPGGPLAPPALPTLIAPVGNTGAGAFELVFPDVLPPADPGLYSVILTEATVGSPGRVWRLWRKKEAGSGNGNLSLLAPDIAELGGTTLTPGPWTVAVQVQSHPALSLDSFAWKDLGRHARRSARTRATFLSNP